MGPMDLTGRVRTRQKYKEVVIYQDSCGLRASKLSWLIEEREDGKEFVWYSIACRSSGTFPSRCCMSPRERDRQ